MIRNATWRRPLGRRSLVMALGAAAATAAAAVGSAEASQSWPGIEAEVYAGRALHDGLDVVTLKAPYRPDDNRSVPLSVEARFNDGRSIKSVTFIVDENPSPVAAVFRLGGARDHVALTTNIRLNQQSDVHIVVEASDGELYVTERLVKFAGGQASCSAPPMGDPAEIAANMGKMDFAAVGEKAAASHAVQRARVQLNHPNHTGMVLDQITLLYVPLLMVDRIEARQGDELVFELAGSITLAQNPVVEFDYVTNGAEEMTVAAKDTSGAQWARRFPIGPAS
jgi:sulfur-oxidizing protein SoxY